MNKLEERLASISTEDKAIMFDLVVKQLAGKSRFVDVVRVLVEDETIPKTSRNYLAAYNVPYLVKDIMLYDFLLRVEDTQDILTGLLGMDSTIAERNKHAKT